MLSISDTRNQSSNCLLRAIATLVRALYPDWLHGSWVYQIQKLLLKEKKKKKKLSRL